MHSERENRKIGLAGTRGSGKTALMKDLIRAFRKGGLAVKGVFSPGIFEANEKIAVEIVDLASDHSRLAAKLSTIEQTELQYGDWSFFQKTFDWANQQLSIVQDSDVFVIDEIGPLELELGKGLKVGLAKVTQANYDLGLFTARPKCIDRLSARFPDLEIFWLRSWDREELIDKILRIVDLSK